MPQTFHIVHVEDSPDDSELVKFALRHDALKWTYERVETEGEYTARLDARTPDVIICDYDLPRFSAGRALEILKERGLELPFILVSHHIGESAAVVAMQQGASDYLPKSDLGRLPKAIRAAVERSNARKEAALALEALRESELMQRSILDSVVVRIALLDGEGVIRGVNKLWHEFTASVFGARGIDLATVGVNYLDLLAERHRLGFGHAQGLCNGARWYLTRVTPIANRTRGAVILHDDITERVMTYAALRDANKRLRNLSKRVLTVQEEERRAISRELHDDVGQTLGALKIGLHRLNQGGAGDAAKLTAECLATAGTALDRLRTLSHELRPPQLDQLGLEDALRWLAERQSAATGLAIECAFPETEHKRAPQLLESACFRIAQEALNNATKHAQAKAIRIALQADGRLLKLTIRDDGVGFDEEAARSRTLKTGSMGLIGMDERAQLAGGRLKVRSILGGGTTVSAIFPLDLAVNDAEIDSQLAASP
jgi:two-component system sensor histidine kinase UhpB